MCISEKGHAESTVKQTGSVVQNAGAETLSRDGIFPPLGYVSWQIATDSSE